MASTENSSSNTSLSPNLMRKQQHEESVASYLNQALMLRSRSKFKDAVLKIQKALSVYGGVEELLCEMGVCLFYLQQHSNDKNMDEVVPYFEKVLSMNHENVTALFYYASCQSQMMQHKLAVQNFSKALSLCKNLSKETHPPNMSMIRQQLCHALNDCATKLKDQATQLKDASIIQAAIDHYQQAISVDPTFVPAHYNLGVLHGEMGQWREAWKFYEKVATELQPNHLAALCNMGVIARSMGQLPIAIQHYQKALVVDPNSQIVKLNLATALNEFATQTKAQNGKKKEVKKLYKQALFYHSTYAEVYYNLGVLHAEYQDFEKALYYYEMTTHFDKQFAKAFHNMAVIYKQQYDNSTKAVECYKAALQTNQPFVQTYNNLAILYTLQGKMSEALHYLREAIACNPIYADSYNNLGVLLRDEGNLKESYELYKKCLQLDPNCRNANHNKLLALNYLELSENAQDGDISMPFIYQEHAKWGEAFVKQVDVYRSWDHIVTEKDKVIRIGYMSPDFFAHAVSYFIDAPLRHHDHSKFQIFCYSNVMKEDLKTERFKQYISKQAPYDAKKPSFECYWRNIQAMTSEQVAAKIREDKIDILIELAGHTAFNKLDVMALKPAPLQVSWIGYCNTTGLPTVDYRIVDKYTDPPLDDTDAPYTSESLVRLSHFLCYTPCVNIKDPLDWNVEVAPAPFLKNDGIITFGTFNNVAKITDTVVAVWAKILNSVPNSRLLLKSKPFDCDRVKTEFFKKFEKHGIASSRLDFFGLIPNHNQHLSTYSMLDISLDTFPFAGTTTTCECLFMGVPVITLIPPKQSNYYRLHVQRVGYSLLNAIGGHKYEKEMVACSEQEYIEKAVQLAKNKPRLIEIRQELHEAMIQSDLCNGTKFTSELEQLYRQLWTTYCEKQAPQDADAQNKEVLFANECMDEKAS